MSTTAVHPSATAAIGGKGPVVLAVTWITTAIAVIAVALRAYAASHTNGKWRWDFLWACACIFFGVAASIACTIAVFQGLGNHVMNLVTLGRQTGEGFNYIWRTVHWLWIGIFIGLVATTFAKYSMIALMLQVQGPAAKKRRIALYALGVLFTIVNLIQIILSYLQCRPIEKLWNRAMPGQCNGGAIATNWSIFQGSVGAFADFVLALWPVGIAWNLQTTRRVKIMFCALMGVGMLPAIVSGYRVTHIPAPSTSKDITLEFGDFIVLCVVEFYAIVILTSIPVLRPLFLRIFYGIKTATGSKTGTRTKLTAGNGTSHHATRNNKTAPHSSVLDVEKDSSTENLNSRDHVAMNIMVSKAYAVSEDISEVPREPPRAYQTSPRF
ncbi:hypothetical protein K461DRAFT_276996 [Myriangium duriaei CBS 260.36]|uniref:Rhodopsin domain-containing protein n=1 Tax=Myriangium duriaei CBS 260.36 TaxID=1168546 RepID=A0A9P4J3N4_9PEZI|nr:hypothetical protein K461DRAFT_276996 [Myriangium duriaei CBS 260.36]